MASVLDFTKKGVAGSKRQTYLRMKLGEMLTGISIQDNYVSKEMLDGIEREPLARAAYETEENVLVETVGFAVHDEIERFGCSPDGLVGDGGGVELKCPKAGTHLKWILDGVIPEEHRPQVAACLAVTGREWWDFASFNPDVPQELQLMVIRIHRKEAMTDAIEEAARGFIAELDAMVERLRSIVGPFELPAAMAEKVPEADRSMEGFLTEEDFVGLL
jgi:hypothetical protein